MKARHIWANLPVADLKRTARFYTGLGFKANTKQYTQEISSFYFGDNDFVIHFFKRDQMEFAMDDKAANAANGSEVMFSLSAGSEEEVSEWANKALEAGGSVLKKAGRHEDGFYYCVFADPDGHKFNALLIEDGM